MAMNRVRLTICQNEYVIASSEDEGYVRSLGAKLDEALRGMIDKDSRMTVTTAAILQALDYMDACNKAQESADNMRAQIKDYLEDAAKARIECESAKREVERLQREIVALKTRLEIQ